MQMCFSVSHQLGNLLSVTPKVVQIDPDQLLSVFFLLQTNETIYFLKIAVFIRSPRVLTTTLMFWLGVREGFGESKRPRLDALCRSGDF